MPRRPAEAGRSGRRHRACRPAESANAARPHHVFRPAKLAGPGRPRPTRRPAEPATPGHTRRTRQPAETGNAGLIMVAGVGLVMVLLLGLGDLSAYFVARTRAQTAADAAVLAAVAELVPGIGVDPQAAAGRYASANGARLVQCRCPMGSSAAEVIVSVPVRLSLKPVSGITQVRAGARAEIGGLPKSPNP